MKNLILPAFVILIGAGSAFATQNAKNSESKIAEPGYLYNSLTGCEPKAICSTEEGEICTVNNDPDLQQVFGMSQDLSTCNVVLHQPRIN